MNVPTTSVPGLLSPQEVSVHTDTRELLAHAKRDARKRGFQDRHGEGATDVARLTRGRAVALESFGAYEHALSRIQPR